MTIYCTIRRAAVALAVVCAVAAPFDVAAQPAAPEAPDWQLVESPGAAGFGFGLGIDLGWEELDSLATAAATTTVTTRDANGREVTQVIPGDPALTNRKFDFRFEVETAGGQAPIALPRFSLGRAVTVFPSLVIEAAVTDVTFHFDDRTNPEDSTSVTARGTSYGLGLESVATLGRSNRWYLAAGYRYRDLPSLELERSPPVAPFTHSGAVSHDEVRLSQETHRATLRVGRAFRGGRFNPYLGLRGRWTELDVVDELDFRSSLGDETVLRTHTRYESDSALGVAGIDARLGGPVLGRAEVTFGDGDAALLLKTVVRLNPGTPPPPPPPPPIAKAFEKLRRELTEGAEELEPLRASQPELYVSSVLALLDRIEAEGVAVLLYYDFVALADWLRDRFDEARAEVPATPDSLADLRDLQWVPGTRPGVRFASLLGPAPQAPGGNNSAGDKEEAWYESAFRALSLIFIRAKERCLSVRLRFDVEPSQDGAIVIVYPASAPREAEYWPPGDEYELKIGSYTYCIPGKNNPAAVGAEPCGPWGATSRFQFQCLASDENGGPNGKCPLDLVDPPYTRVQCQLGNGRTCSLRDRDPRCSDLDD
jgi:hypothetical protein